MNKKTIICFVLFFLVFLISLFFISNHYKNEIIKKEMIIDNLRVQKEKNKTDIGKEKKEVSYLNSLLIERNKEINDLKEKIVLMEELIGEMNNEVPSLEIAYELLLDKHEQLQDKYDSLEKEYQLFIKTPVNNFYQPIKEDEKEDEKDEENTEDKTVTKPGTIEDKKIAYLTFDDGPSINTIKVLDILKKEKIKATFFVNGKTDEDSLAIYKRIIDEGHALGNHTYTHDYKTIYKSVDNFEKDFNQLNELFDTLGVKTSIMRYPGGSNNKVSNKYGGKEIMYNIVKHMNNKGYVFFDWNVDSGDASAALVNSSTLINNVKNGSKNKNHAIILMHDTKAKSTTPEALPTIIQNLKNDGFEFEVLTKNGFNNQFLKTN